jgi:hypothetical protein
MRAYRQTFRQHRVLLTLPVVLSALVAGWFTFGAAPQYRSTASLWVDNGPAGESSLTDVADPIAPGAGSAGVADTPASLEQTNLQQLLHTADFDLAVARGSSLPRFLAAHNGGGFSPTALLHSPSTDPILDAAGTIGTAVTITTPGPQVLLLGFTGPTPRVATSVLASLISHIEGRTGQFGTDYGKTAQGVYSDKARNAAVAAANARASLADYRRTHATASGRVDTIEAALDTQVQATTARLAVAQAALRQEATYAQNGGGIALLRVIDQPAVPSGPVSGASTAVLGVAAGAFAGLLISLLAVIALSPGRPGPWDAELFPSRRRTPT